jgi:cobalamin biosynthesis Mg chelatase CobN
MACLPALAQAEESGNIQYGVGGEIPTVPNNESSPTGSGNPGGGNAPDGSTPDTPTSNAPGGAGSGDGGGDSGKGDSAHQGQTNQGSGGGDGQAVDGSKPAGGGQGRQRAIEVTPIEPTSSTSDGDSSPLVPILIAIAVLAAISVGAFYYRQRRQDEAGSPISPNAS